MAYVVLSYSVQKTERSRYVDLKKRMKLEGGKLSYLKIKPKHYFRKAHQLQKTILEKMFELFY